MKIERIFPHSYTTGQTNCNAINFGAAADITIEYAFKKHSKYLPASMIQKIKDLIAVGQGKRRLCEVHNEVFKDLFDAKTLDEVKDKYTELEGVNDVTLLASNRSKAIKALKKI